MLDWILKSIHSRSLSVSFLWWNINQFVAGGVAPFRFPVSILTVWFFLAKPKLNLCHLPTQPLPRRYRLACNCSQVCQVRFLLLLYTYIYYALCCSLALWVYRFSAFSVPLRVNNFVNWKQILRAGSRTRGIAIAKATASQPSQPAGCETNSVHKKTPGSNRCDQTLYPEL